MNSFVFIGGKSQENNSVKIENEIVRLSNKDYPSILFFPQASKDEIKSYKKFISQTFYSKFHCECFYSNNKIYLNLSSFDIYYFGGGNTELLVKSITDLGLYERLIKEDNKVIVGVSAGAIMWFKSGMGDCYSYYDNFHYYNFKMIKGINYFDFTFCPHYQKEDLIVYNDELKKYCVSGFAAEDDTAIIIRDKIFYIIKNNNRNSVYYFPKFLSYRMVNLKTNNIYDLK